VSNVGVLIFFALLGAVICARARVASGAILFGVLATVLFVGTPVGAGLPGAVMSFLSTIKDVTAPVTQGSHGGAG
jgi:hypothetical protein